MKKTKSNPVPFQERISLSCGEMDGMWKDVTVSIHETGTRMLSVDLPGVSFSLHMTAADLDAIAALIEQARAFVIPEAAQSEAAQ